MGGNSSDGLLLEQGVDGICQLAVTVGDYAPRIMRVQFNAHITVFVVKRRMMAFLLRQEGHAGHEGECLLKILEPEFPGQSIVLFKPHGGCFQP